MLLPTYQIKGEQNGRTTDKITILPPINDYHLPSKDWSNPEEASLYQKTSSGTSLDSAADAPSIAPLKKWSLKLIVPHAEITNLVGRSQHSTIQLERPQHLAIWAIQANHASNSSRWQSLSTTTSHRWLVDPEQRAMICLRQQVFHQRILVVLESSTLEIQEIWEPQIWHVGLTWREFADNEKRAWKKDGSQTSSTKIVLSYHDYIWLSCHLGMGETQVTRRMDGYKQKSHLERALQSLQDISETPQLHQYFM